MAKKYLEAAQAQELIDDVKERLATKVDKKDAPYKPGGTIAFADLPAATQASAGFVYDINEVFTTTSDFVEGAGIEVEAGTDVAIIMLPPVDEYSDPTYKYNLFGGSGKVDDITSLELEEMWKDAGVLTLSDSTISLLSVGSTDAVTIDEATGAISIESSDEDIAVATLSGTTITIEEIAAGEAVVTVTSGSTANNRKISKTIAVTCA